VNARQRRPIAVLVDAAQTPHEVDAPRLDIVRVEFQCAERNANFGKPTIFDDTRFHVPDAIPVRVVFATFVRHLRVPLRAHWVDRKLIAIAAIVERVKDNLEAVA
jgi:hypothetical protein